MPIFREDSAIQALGLVAPGLGAAGSVRQWQYAVDLLAGLNGSSWSVVYSRITSATITNNGYVQTQRPLKL